METINRAVLGGFIGGVDVHYGKVWNEVNDAYAKEFDNFYGKDNVKGLSPFKVETTKKAVETYSGVTSAGLTKITAEGADYATDRIYTGFRTAAVPMKFTNSLSMTDEAMSDIDVDYRGYIDAFKAMATGAHQVEAKAMFDLLLGGWTAQSSLAAYISSYGDGKSTFSQAHPLVDGSGTFSNTFSSAVTQLPLTEASLELARLNILNQTDGRGNPLSHGKMVLIVSSANEANAVRLTSGVERPGTANRDVNVYTGRYTVLAVQGWLNALPTAWFLCDEALVDLVFVRREGVTQFKYVKANKSEVFAIKHRFCVVPRKVVGIFGSKGDSSAFSG